MSKNRMDMIPLNEEFTIDNLKSICKQYKINVFILTELGSVNYFVKTEKQKSKVIKL